MATFSQNGIQFTATKGNVLPGKYSNGHNDEFNTAQIDGVEPLINAVEIDWNGADLSSAASSFANAADTAPVSTITTTVELIKGVYSPMFAKAA